jgi:hypothetical protein
LKDQRYRAIKSLIEAKGIQGFQDIFTIIPISIVKTDIKMNYNTLRRRINKVELLTVKDVKALAKLFDVQEAALFQLILADANNQSTPKRKVK